MDAHATACAALEKVLLTAPALRLIVGLNHAAVVEMQADDALKRLQASTEVTPQVANVLCTLTHTCMSLVNSVDEDMIADINECFGVSALMVWGFNVEVAEIICFSLTAVANTIRGDAEGAAFFEVVGKDLDNIAVHLFGGLCRLHAVTGTSSPEARLLKAFQCICVWTLVILQRFVGQGGITSEVLWEWVSEDALWAFLLAKGIVLFRVDCAPEFDVGLICPTNIIELKESVIRAVANLGSTSIAFRGELDPEFEWLDFQMAYRIVQLAQHRAKLGVAAVDSDLLETLICEALQVGGPPWFPYVVSLLANLTMQPPSDDRAWADMEAVQDEYGQPHKDIFTLIDARGVADAVVAQVSAYMDDVWNLLSSSLWTSIVIHRCFFSDCATLAFVLPPHAAASQAMFETPFQEQRFSCLEPSQVAALCALAANSGIVPTLGKPLANSLQLMNLEMKARVAERAIRCRIPIRNSEAWRLWSEMLGADGKSPEPQQCEQKHPPQPLLVAPASASRPGLRELMKGAPVELCCSLDGKLLVDPVRSPHGQVYERSNLLRRLTATPGLCPVTGLPLALEHCPRAPDIRIRAQQWVRQVRPMERVF